MGSSPVCAIFSFFTSIFFFSSKNVCSNLHLCFQYHRTTFRQEKKCFGCVYILTIRYQSPEREKQFYFVLSFSSFTMRLFSYFPLSCFFITFILSFSHKHTVSKGLGILLLLVSHHSIGMALRNISSSFFFIFQIL